MTGTVNPCAMSDEFAPTALSEDQEAEALGLRRIRTVDHRDEFNMPAGSSVFEMVREYENAPCATASASFAEGGIISANKSKSVLFFSDGCVIPITGRDLGDECDRHLRLVRLEDRAQPRFSGHNRVVVDWDDTCVRNEWPEKGEWLDGAREGLRALLDAGFEVVVSSTRLAPTEPDEVTPRPAGAQDAEVQAVRDKLDEAGLHAVDIWLRPWKPGAIAYVDDKAVPYSGDWSDVLDRLVPQPKGTLSQAAQLVRGARQQAYGHPLDNHARIAAFWTTRLRDKLKPGVAIEPHEVTAMQRLVKEARLMETPGHEDSLVDIAGYADAENEIHQEIQRREDTA